MNISELTLVQLKAMVYDHLSAIEASQESIKNLNVEIQRKSQAERPAPPEGKI